MFEISKARSDSASAPVGARLYRLETSFGAPPFDISVNHVVAMDAPGTLRDETPAGKEDE